MKKPWINLHFKYQEGRIPHLETMIKSLTTWQVDDIFVRIFIDENSEAKALKKQLQIILPDLSIQEINVHDEPMSLFKQHKNYLPFFNQSDFTHFIFADADLEIDNSVFQYWVETRELFRTTSGYESFIPGTVRVEDFNGLKRLSDITYRTNIDDLVIVKIDDKYFFSPTEPFQDIGILDKDLAVEHLSLPYTVDDYHFGYIGVNRFGYAETMLSGHIFFNNPYMSCVSRILYPLDDYERSWYYHLPANYAANEKSEHGKIPAHEFYKAIRGALNDRG